jgi:phosphoglycerol transferase
MKTRLRDNELIKRASLYITAAVLCMVFLCVFLQIWRADLRIPFYYVGDATFYAMATKGIVENGWYWQNPSLGAPGVQQMYDFPTFDNAVVLLTLLLSTFTGNPFLVMNLYYLLSFPLITIASLYVLRQFNISYAPALFSSLLYAFLPYHFMRNTSYFVLAAYYVIPPAIMIVLWIIREDLAPRTRKFVISVLVCILLGSSGVYYPFFFCFLLLVGGATGALKLQKIRPLAMAIVLTGITAATVVINLSPAIIYKYRQRDARVMVRGPQEAEKYALKISNLVLPITGHRLGLFDRVKNFHNTNSTVSDDDASSLGLVATIGFLGLLVQLMRRKELGDDARGAGDLLHDLSVLNIFSVLLGTIGGFGLLFALYISTGIRSYNRISICIAFFSLMAVAIGLDSIYRRTARVRSIFYVVLAVVFVFAFLDQTTAAYVPKYEKNKAEFLDDQQFVNQIESSVPAGAMIFQLPYIPFPEHPRVNKMADYDHLRGYLHSKNLRWSYGAIKNRDVDLAQRQLGSLASSAPGELVEKLVAAGFSGIYVDRYGFEDNGAALESELSNLLQATPFASPNGRLAFYNLVDYGNRLRQKYSDTEWEREKELSLHPLLLEWKGGFSDLESRSDKTWRWCSSEGELHLRNTSQLPRSIKLEMSFATGYEQLDDFSISGLISEQFKVNDKPYFYAKTVTAPPGESIIKFRSAARRVNAPSDTRFLVFRIEDFKLTELD